MARKNQSVGLFARIIPLIFLVIMVWLVISTVSFAFKVFYSYLAIPLLIMALVLNYSVVTDHFAGLIRYIKEDTGKGLLKAAGNMIFYPFVFGFLAMKAWGKRTLGSKRGKKEPKKGDYIKYEEVEADEDDFLELEDIDKPKVKVTQQQTRNKSNNDYDDLFS